MMIIRNTNRLINDFKNQSADTIWKFMDAMAVNYTVYSTHLKGLSPFLTDYDVYLYCNDTNVVIVCLDCCGHNDEQVYAESDSLSSIIFNDDQEPRASVVWKLKEAVRLAKIRLKSKNPDVKVYGLLLTEADILNAYELYRLWDANNITVIDSLRRLKNRKIKTNADYELSCKDYVEVVTDTTFNQGDTNTPTMQASLVEMSDKSVSANDEDDEFEKVLMVDEAYLLNGKNDNDPGKMVIQLLMNILADEKQRDIAVVLCGYKEPMMKLLDSNPGLYSRFPNKFEFTDFTVDELLEITLQKVKEYGYKFTAKAWGKYCTILAQAYAMRDAETWGNARFVTNQLEHIYIQHATRCIKHQPKDKQDLLKLTPEDILPIEIPRQKTRIGF